MGSKDSVGGGKDSVVGGKGSERLGVMKRLEWVGEAGGVGWRWVNVVPYIRG